jgi:hypothetical protein
MPGIEREELEGLRNDLAAYRKAYAHWSEHIKELEAEHATDYSALKLAKEIRDGAELELRQKLCDFFYLTEDKQPVPGLSIKEVKKLEYDADRALDWVLGKLVQNILGLHALGKTRDEMVDDLRNNAIYLTLDGDALKKGKFGPNTPFKEVTVAQATIATDLNKFLE